MDPLTTPVIIITMGGLFQAAEQIDRLYQSKLVALEVKGESLSEFGLRYSGLQMM